MFGTYKPYLETQLAAIREAGTYKRERVIVTPQGTSIRVADGKPVLNLCANNYLGLAQHPEVAQAAKQAGKSVDEVASTWTVPAKYAGYAAPQPARLKSNVQVVYDELAR